MKDFHYNFQCVAFTIIQKTSIRDYARYRRLIMIFITEAKKSEGDLFFLFDVTKRPGEDVGEKSLYVIAAIYLHSFPECVKLSCSAKIG